MHRLQLLSLMRFLGETRVCICLFYGGMAVLAADVGSEDQTLRCCCSPRTNTNINTPGRTWTATYVYLVYVLVFLEVPARQYFGFEFIIKIYYFDYAFLRK